MSEYKFSEVDHKTLGGIILQTLKEKGSLLILGRSGIGKSQLVVETAKRFAEENKKEFVLWNDIPEDKKEEIKNDGKDYFILLIFPMSQSDVGEFKVPFPHSKDTFRYLINDALYLFSKYEGVIFVDEINLVQSKNLLNIIYQLVLDRRVADIKLKASIIGAGNISDDKAPIVPLSAPLVRRFVRRVVLLPPTKEEMISYLISRGSDERIVDFVSYRETCYDFDTVQFSKVMIPATLEMAGKIIKNMDDEEATQQVAQIMGPAIGAEFKSFITLRRKINPVELLQTPEKVSKLNRSEKFVAEMLIARELASSDKYHPNFVRAIKTIEDKEFIVSTMMMVKLVEYSLEQAKNKNQTPKLPLTIKLLESIKQADLNIFKELQQIILEINAIK